MFLKQCCEIDKGEVDRCVWSNTHLKCAKSYTN